MSEVFPKDDPDFDKSCLQPIREKDEVFVIVDGKKIVIEPLMVGIIAERWNDAVRGAYIWMKNSG